MKRVAILFGMLIISIQLFAQKPLVVSSASLFDDMARNIGGDLFEYKMIVPVGGDPHLHEPKPSDAILVSSADMILINGLTFEGWINELIENSGTDAKVATITEGVTPLQSEKYANAVDPHAWMSVSNARIYIKNIAKALKAILPADAPKINANYQSYDSELVDLDVYIKRQLAKIPAERRILITSHDAFNYYGNEYGIELDAILGLSTEAEIQTSDIRRINKIIQERSIPSIFVESTINPKVMKQIAKDNEVKIGEELFADSLSEPGTSAATYIGMMTSNTDAIVNGLTGQNDNENQTSGDNDSDQNESSSMALYILLGLFLLAATGFLVKKLS